MPKYKIFISIFILMILLSLNSFSQSTDYVFNKVVIDAGHGGKDPGATFGNIFEKDIVLDVALKTGEMIKNKFPEIKVIYTRDKDIFIPLDERAKIANRNKADLFISIHVNSCKNKMITGAETYILGRRRNEDNLEVAKMENSVILLEDDYTTKYEGFDPNQAESYIMFEMIQNEFLEMSRLFAEKVQKNIISSTKIANRGVRQDCFLVIRETAMPSVLIELGFISNEEERQYLGTENAKRLMSQSIFSAISEYKQRFDERNTAPIPGNDKKISRVTDSSVKKVDEKANNKTKLDTVGIKTDQSMISERKIFVIDSSFVKISELSGKWYGVQIMASKVAFTSKDTIFKNQSPLYYLYENGYHKFFIGVSQDSNPVLQLNKKVQSLFPGSFPVAFIDGKKIPFAKPK